MTGILRRCIRHFESVEKDAGESDIAWYVDQFVAAKTSGARVDVIKRIGIRSIAPLSASDNQELVRGCVGEYREWGKTFYYVTLVGLLMDKIDSGGEVMSGVFSSFQLLDARWNVEASTLKISEAWLLISLVILIEKEDENFDPDVDVVWNWLVRDVIVVMEQFFESPTRDFLEKVDQERPKHRGWGDFCTNVAILTKQGVYSKKSGGPWTLSNARSAKDGLYELLREGQFKLSELEMIDFVEELQKLRKKAFYKGLVTSSQSTLLEEIREECCS